MAHMGGFNGARNGQREGAECVRAQHLSPRPYRGLPNVGGGTKAGR
jgi:hypothetical protein